jgi:electron transfer flavoprotein alpha/beta subunit
VNILVFTKRVPATQEEELRIIDDGKAVDLSKVPFKVNDWDNYSVEEAVRIAKSYRHGRQ